MKGLNNFIRFDWNAFADGKVFLVTGVSEWVDYDTKAHLGTKVDVVIAVDNTAYPFKNGQEYSNRYEKISLKVNKDMSIPLDSKVMPKGVTAKVYGEYNHLLSIKCSDITVLAPPAKDRG